MSDTVLVWLRRELRLQDNAAIDAAARRGTPFAVLFVLDDEILLSARACDARVAMMYRALANLDGALREFGSRLIVQRGTPAHVVPYLAERLGAVAVYANRDYTPYARRRDAMVGAALGRVPLHLCDDRLLVAPESIRKDDGGVYTVFTPFNRRWRDIPKAAPFTTILHGRIADVSSFADEAPFLRDFGADRDVSASSFAPASPQSALRQLNAFLAAKAHTYDAERNMLGEPGTGTSFMSPAIRWGLLSPRQIYAAAAHARDNAPGHAAPGSIDAWLNEIAWHEFFTHILWHFPHVKSRNFNARNDVFPWRHAPDDFAAWCDGRTGYPVVDAAMRQLRTIGWMHNRARMIAASFLTKHLLVDWREGEAYFMKHLLDGDTAVNNGNWQWVAGTGTDAQPYFRIFNPVTQSQKFDPQAAYIRRWVPELRDIDLKYIHAPWTAPEPPADYPPPIVDHTLGRKRALDAFESTKSAR